MMKRKRASEIFAQVDPKLKVIDGGTRHHKYKFHQIREEDWNNASGVICPSCQRETMRAINGLCPECWREKETEREEKDGRKREKCALVRAFNAGRITLREMREGHL